MRFPRSIPYFLAALTRALPVTAQIPPEAIFVGGFDHEGRGTQTELLLPGGPLPVQGLRSESAQINAAVVDPLTGEVIVSGSFTAMGGSQGSLHALRLSSAGLASERTVALGDPRAPVRAIALDPSANYVTAGPAGIFTQRRTDGAIVTVWDPGSGRDWNALHHAREEGSLFAATFQGEVWSFDWATGGATFVLSTAPLGFTKSITGIWCEDRPGGKLLLTTLDPSTPLLVLDRATGLLANAPFAPNTGLNAIVGHSIEELYVLGASNPSSDVYRVDARSGIAVTVRQYGSTWATATLALPPAPNTLTAYAPFVFLVDPLDLWLVLQADASAPVGLFLTAFRLQGTTYRPASPFFAGISGPDGAVRLRLQAGTNLYGDLRRGDWMEFQGVWADLTHQNLLLTNVARVTAR